MQMILELDEEGTNLFLMLKAKMHEESSKVVLNGALTLLDRVVDGIYENKKVALIDDAEREILIVIDTKAFRKIKDSLGKHSSC